MKQARASTKDMLVVDSGDFLFKRFSHPVPEHEAEMVAQKARLMIESFNRMGYDAVGVGDDDLTLGKEFLLEISKKAHFPFLSSNLTDGESGKPLFLPYLIKEVSNLRIALFSLIAQESFLGDADPRRKGLTLKPPFEVARAMVKELQPKSDWIILLSHLGYQKDVELAQAVEGIHLIVGSHTGMNLSFPPVVKNTLLLQTAPKGMYAARLDLLLNHPAESGFYNSVTRRSLERNLMSLRSRLNSPQIPERDKAQVQRAQEDAERSLKQLQGKNEFTNTLFPLTDRIEDNPDILSLIEAFRLKFQEPGSSPPQK